MSSLHHHAKSWPASGRRRWQVTRRATVTAAAVLALVPFALAAPASGEVASAAVPVATYDVTSTPAAGWGGWTHTYTGTITSTGRTVVGSAIEAELVDYAGGSGTLNDGVISSPAHLFTNRLDGNGQPIKPVITLHLPGLTYVDALEVYGGNNTFAGTLTAGTVTIGTASEQVVGTPFGTDGYLSNNDRFSLTTLKAVPTQTVVISDIQPGLWFGSYQLDQWPISEVVVLGRPAGAVATDVQIDVKPGDPTATVNLEARGTLPLALLSSGTLNASTGVNRASLTFGRTGSEPSITGWRTDDVNGDGRDDLVLFADLIRTGLRVGDTSARLEGHLTSGETIAGSDTVRVISTP